MSDPANPDRPGDILPPFAATSAASSTPATPDTSRALAVVSRLARSHPMSDELRSLLEGKLGEAVSAAADYAADAIAPATRAAYIRDWYVFVTWCREQGADPNALPIHPVLAAAYLASLAETIGISALRGRLAAIAYHHRRRGLTWSGAHPAVRETMAGIGRAHGKPVRPSAALTSVEVKRLIAGCTQDLAGTRDRALFLVGFAGAFRRSELVAIDVHHLRFEADCVVIHLHRSKGDQAGKGADVTLPRMRGTDSGASDTCPVRALEAWLRRGKIRRGAVFRGITVHGTMEERLTGAGVRHILLSRAAMAKLTVHASERLSPHGLRAGLITEAYLAGAPDEQVAAHTRHGDLSTMRGYRKRARITGDNPARLLDL